MDALHLLAYLLTGNHEKAEQSFVTGLEDCVDNNFVFKEWARSWAQRTIVQSAISHDVAAAQPRRLDHSAETDAKLQNAQAKHAAIATVLALGDFERFVFVL